MTAKQGHKFKVGQRAIMLGEECVDADRGEEVTITDITNDKIRFVGPRGGRCVSLRSGGQPSHKLQPVEKTLDNLEAGDIVIDEDGDEAKVLEVLSNTLLLSRHSNFDSAARWYTPAELKKDNFTVKQDTPADDTVELSIDEIAEKFGISADKVRVKKD